MNAILLLLPLALPASSAELERLSPEFSQSSSTAPAGIVTYAVEGGSHALKAISFCATLEEQLAACSPAEPAGLKKTAWQAELSGREKGELAELEKYEAAARKLCASCLAQRYAADKARLRGGAQGLHMAANLYRTANALEAMASQLFEKACPIRRKLPPGAAKPAP